MTTLDTVTLFPAPESTHDLDAADLERAWRKRDGIVHQLHAHAEQLQVEYRTELNKLQSHTIQRRIVNR